MTITAKKQALDGRSLVFIGLSPTQRSFATFSHKEHLNLNKRVHLQYTTISPVMYQHPDINDFYTRTK